MFNLKYVLLYISHFTLYLLLNCQAVLAENDQFEIFLKSRQFIPETSISTTDAIALKQLHAVNNEDYGINKVHVIVQLTRIPNNEQKEQWKDQGIELLSYIPNNAWYAAISVPIKTVAEHVEVRSVVMLKPMDKIEPKILNDGIGDWAKNPDGTVTLTVIFYEDIPPSLVQAVLNKYGNTVHGPGMLNDWVVSIPETSLHDLASEDPVKWVNEIPSPPEDFNDGARAAARVNSVQAHIDVREMDLSGYGVNVGMWETFNPDVEHIDFGGRVTIAEDDQVQIPGRHATHVVGTLGGDGNQSINNGGMAFQWRGTAPGVELYSYTTSVNPYSEPEEHESAISDNGIDLSNNSWGPAENLGQYDGRSVKYDKVVRGLYGKQIPIIFAAGNEQKKGPFGTISPGGGTAKNTITVGVTNSNDDTLYTGDEGSSQGPTNDGRIKPDVVAPGCEKGGDGGIKSTLPGDSYGLLTTKCGTSFATPVVSGTIALMLERYREIEQDDTAIPLPSTYKGILIHTAKDLGNPGPDYQFGYGRINAKKAIHILDNDQFQEGDITSQGEKDIYTATIENNTLSLKATLAWDDYPGQPSVNKHLVNNLDLVIVDPNSTEYFPWMLDPDNPGMPATKDVDDINNVEQVVVTDPIPGDWIIKVKGTSIPQASQTYSLVYSTETPDFILTANDQHTVEVRLSNEDGTFAAPVTVGNDLGVKYGEFAIADFNGDGQLDFIASTNENPPKLYLFKRTGPVTFDQRQLFDLAPDPKAAYYLEPLGGNNPLVAPDYGLGLIAADLDNDGDIDFLENLNGVFKDIGNKTSFVGHGNFTINDCDGDGQKEVQVGAECINNPHFWITHGHAWINDGGQTSPKCLKPLISIPSTQAGH